MKTLSHYGKRDTEHALYQRRSQDFGLGGGTQYIFRHLSGSRPHSKFCVGGGSSRNFSRSQINHVPSLPGNFFLHFSGHLRITLRLWTFTEIQAHFPRLLTHSNHVTTSIHSGKKHLPKVGGGHGPRAPPLATPLLSIHLHRNMSTIYVYNISHKLVLFNSLPSCCRDSIGNMPSHEE